MPADEYQIQIASWPGCAGVVGFHYLCAHGIHPGIASLTVTVDPRISGNAGFGDLMYSDGTRTVVLRDCKVTNIRYERDGDGERWTLLIADRRWRWSEEQGSIGGIYNLLDPHTKLIPWTIRSPYELAELCLKAMGETNYLIDVPPGVSGADFAEKDNWFELGVVSPFGVGLVNPPVEWNVEYPAQALSRLCAEFMRRVVFDPIENRVIIAKPGDGAQLPELFLTSRGLNVEAPKTPSLIGLIGAEMEFQGLWRLRAVLPEWHRGEFLPIDQVSYKPTVKVTGGRPWDKSALGDHYDVQATANINFDRARTLAQQNLWSLYRFDDIGVNPPLQQEPQKINVPGYGLVKNRWRLKPLPHRVERVAPVARDDRQITRATSLAPVYDYYDGYSRVLDPILKGKVGKLTVGNWWLGMAAHDNTPDGERIDVGLSIDPIYQLVRLDRPVYLWHPWKRLTGDAQGRTHDFVFRPAPLVLECAVQVLDDKTNAPVRYRRWRKVNDDGTLGEVHDNYANPRNYPGGPDDAENPDQFTAEWHEHGDVELNQYGVYEFIPQAVVYQANDIARTEWDEWDGGRYTLTEVKLEDESDTAERADHYLQAHILRHQIRGGVVNTYAGIMPISLDGAIMQVEWSAGAQGCETTASRNCETSIYISPYPWRRWRENMPPDQKLAQQNLHDRKKINTQIAMLAKAVRII